MTAITFARDNSHNIERRFKTPLAHCACFVGQDNCRKLSKMLNSQAVAICIVSYLDIEGLRHTVEVDAGSLYEAAVLAIRTFRQHDCEPGQAARLEVEVRSSVTHIITPMKVHEWLNGGARSPKEAVMKERLRGILS